MGVKDTFPELADLADQLTPCPAHIKTDRALSFTTYTITGYLTDVLNMVRVIFDDYHPLGYGTKVDWIRMLDGGLYQGRIWRANSCD